MTNKLIGTTHNKHYRLNDSEKRPLFILWGGIIFLGRTFFTVTGSGFSKQNIHSQHSNEKLKNFLPDPITFDEILHW